MQIFGTELRTKDCLARDGLSRLLTGPSRVLCFPASQLKMSYREASSFLFQGTLLTMRTEFHLKREGCGSLEEPVCPRWRCSEGLNRSGSWQFQPQLTAGLLGALADAALPAASPEREYIPGMSVFA